jgi:hypothetical protein
MRLEEYLRKRDEFARREKRFNLIYLPIFFGLLIGNLFLVSVIPENWGGWWLYLIGFFALLLGNVWFTRRREKKVLSEAGLNCRSCRHPLFGVHGDLAVTTGRCAYCGGQAFDQAQA